MRKLNGLYTCSSALEALYQWVCDRDGINAKILSEVMGKPLSYVYKVVEGDRHFPLPDFVRATRESGDARLLAWICNECGGMFIERPDITDHRDVEHAAANAMKESAEAVSAFLDVTADGKITVDERKIGSREINEAVRALLKLAYILEEESE